MNIKETSGWNGRFLIEVFEDGIKKDETIIYNRLTDAALNLIRNILYGDAVEAQINYFAVGSGTDAIDDTDTTLGTETFRAAVSTRTKTSTGVLDTVGWLLAGDGALTIREIGIFAEGTGDPDSGTLISRILYTRDKTALESIRISRTDTIGRA